MLFRALPEAFGSSGRKVSEYLVAMTKRWRSGATSSPMIFSLVPLV
jgi:hypothetical protein